ncbi:putative dual-specificity RNA methyltransferase RlmN [Methylacidimicrobium sp. AP8]|uniref:23S rRNA (adenine(2503)-C(2))-methyltransferase RlmN n=1 Tax=Methylacidimicrobium sp. AP8 TaxID=2730359 RepID=UPI0018C1AAAC|nr:23S rRNA (adenine(2503)-C(2))-methyltransferase RlmN [Methylacidimicrobium sp. AP8]CAB4244550.1 putative dual-specificity RNA methyltransferase RlmN [Methylacidimicrobium sp. AP8]
MKRHLLDQTPDEWEIGSGPSYQRSILRRWVFAKRAPSFERMTSLPSSLRAELAGRYRLRALRAVRRLENADGVQKLLWKLDDGEAVESVVIPSEADPGSGRLTLCLSSQIGCAYRCAFCASGLLGFRRNLSSGEIVEQLLQAEAIVGRRMDNLVFMGMGEPLANWDSLLRALRLITAPWGAAMSPRRITISTSGLVPEIRRLADQPLAVGLAVSLHAADDALRSRLMPVNRRYPLPLLLDACEEYSRKKRQPVTLEYILLAGVNDSDKEGARLGRIARRLRAKVNLIPYNRVEGLPWERPEPERVDRFERLLRAAGCRVTVRRRKGEEIYAACGQLRLITPGDSPGGGESVPPSRGTQVLRPPHLLLVDRPKGE